MAISVRFLFRALFLPALTLSLAACDGDPVEPGPLPDAGLTMTVDASDPESWVLVDLAEPAVVVTAEDRQGSAEWDLAFQVSRVRVNGGEDGPAGMVVYCLCEHAGDSDEQIMALTPEAGLAGFEQLTIADVPAAGTGWSAATLQEAPWYRYNLAGGHQIWPTYNSYFLKRGTELYKIQVTGYYDSEGKARQITFRYARLDG